MHRIRFAVLVGLILAAAASSSPELRAHRSVRSVRWRLLHQQAGGVSRGSSAAWLSPRGVGQCCANARSPRRVRSGR